MNKDLPQLSESFNSSPIRFVQTTADFLDLSHTLLNSIVTYPGSKEGDLIRYAQAISGFRMSVISSQFGLLVSDQQISQVDRVVALNPRGVETLRGLGSYLSSEVTT